MTELPPMRAAFKEAKKSKLRFQMGAAIAKGNKVLAKAHNNHKTHPSLGSGLFNTQHAESAVLIKAANMGIDLQGKDIYIYRKNGLKSFPCPCCLNHLKEAGIKKVVYCDNQKVKAAIIN